MVHRPLVFGISEANICGLDKNLVEVTDYNIHLGPETSNGLSRIVVYSHKDINVKPRPDLSNQNFSSVWLECSIPKQKKFLLCNAYREWQIPGVENSLSVPEQLSRWQVFLSQWERVTSSGSEVIILGDMNINHLNWMETSKELTSQTRKLRPLIEELFVRIIPLGFSQMVKVATRHFPGQKSTGLDHVFTNAPAKIQETKAYHWGGSDHMLGNQNQ